MLPLGRHYGALLLDFTPRDVVDQFEAFQTSQGCVMS